CGRPGVGRGRLAIPSPILNCTQLHPPFVTINSSIATNNGAPHGRKHHSTRYRPSRRAWQNKRTNSRKPPTPARTTTIRDCKHLITNHLDTALHPDIRPDTHLRHERREPHHTGLVEWLLRGNL